MRRLLQGDVGSGKTIVAIQAMMVAMENGYQAALMAPTEILATQHFLAARKLLEKSSRKPRIVLLTGSLDEDRKRHTRGLINRGEAQLVIGTHALIEEKVEFDRLGLVVVDEQHRFGVLQRFKLMKKPNQPEPDVLVMTATPIPRTLALSLYGDLDLSVLDELPPGRTPIVTRRVPGERSEEVWEFVRKEVAQKRQAYIVYPVIEGSKDDQPELDFSHDDPEVGIEPTQPFTESQVSKAGPFGKVRAGSGASNRQFVRKGKTAELFPRAVQEANPGAKSGLKSAVEMHEKLSTGPLAGLRVGLLHGRLDADEKEIIMRRFQRGEIDVLVATTVIEVGVDVPNATVMVVEHAERFGLAQLHQLRGRVGRGSARSCCILITGPRVTPLAEERLNAMVRTQDGFELAELDLNLRGPGEFFGTRQAGLPDFRVANLLRDRQLLELAKMEAARFANAPCLATRRSNGRLSERASGRDSKKPGNGAMGWWKQAEQSRISCSRVAGSGQLGGKGAVHHLHRKGLNLKVDAGNLSAAIMMVVASALAELCKANMPALAQFQPGCDQHTVDIHAGLPLELEQHAHRAGIVCATAQNPAAAAENRACESLDQPRRVLYRDGPHLHRPGDAHRLYRAAVRHLQPHNGLIGAGLAQHNVCAGVERLLTVFDTPRLPELRRTHALVIGVHGFHRLAHKAWVNHEGLQPASSRIAK